MKKRWSRVFRHLGGRRDPGIYPRHAAWWVLELLFYLLDAFFLPDLLMLTDRLLKAGRRLTLQEIALARSVYGGQIEYARVLLDNKAHLGPRWFGFAYVGFRVIKSWGNLPDPVLIHELIHVWQYQRFGAVYIPRALWAQHFGGGYDYGGEQALRRVHDSGGSLLNFNYEQMGEVVADYFRLMQGYRPIYCSADQRLIPLFSRIVARTWMAG